MENRSIFNIENDFIHSIFTDGEIGSNELKKVNPSDERNGLFVFPLFLELIQRIEQSMESIKQFTQVSQGKFFDQAFGDHFHQVIHEEIGKVDLLLGCVQNYIKINYSIKKTNTVHKLIEEALIKHQAHMERKKIRVYKKFEEGLPEMTAPDEHLRYILDSLLQYAIVLIPPNGGIGFVTRSLIIQKEPRKDSPSSLDEGKYVEILVLFDGYRKTIGQLGNVLKESFPTKKEGLDIELRLMEEMVIKNQGRMKFEIDEKKRRTSISLRFPLERRKGIY
jgi:nitrogen-specific signal transduction histidine kinase